MLFVIDHRGYPTYRCENENATIAFQFCDYYNFNYNFDIKRCQKNEVAESCNLLGFYDSVLDIPELTPEKWEWMCENLPTNSNCRVPFEKTIFRTEDYDRGFGTATEVTYLDFDGKEESQNVCQDKYFNGMQNGVHSLDKKQKADIIGKKIRRQDGTDFVEGMEDVYVLQGSW